MQNVFQIFIKLLKTYFFQDVIYQIFIFQDMLFYFVTQVSLSSKILSMRLFTKHVLSATIKQEALAYLCLKVFLPTITYTSCTFNTPYITHKLGILVYTHMQLIK